MRLSFVTHPIKVIGSCSSFYSFRFLPSLRSSSSFYSSVRSWSLKPHSVDYNRRSSLRFIMAATALKASSIGATVGRNGEGIARRLWIKLHNDVIRALYTPFVLCLASGNLKIETFHQYIAQDVHFLKAFAQAYELAEECADDDDAKVAISDLRKSVKEELKMHDSFVQEWGTDMIKNSNLNPATVKYTDFLVAAASGKIDGVKGPVKFATPFERTKLAGYTLGAMTPCMRLYAFIGNELQKLPDHNGCAHPYRKWIDNYASESFQTAAQQTEDLLDKLSVPLTGEELDIIEKLYHQAMNLELDFFIAQPLSQPVVLPLVSKQNLAENGLLIFSDFDLTCTIVDSSAILAEIAIVTAPKTDQNLHENGIVRMSSTDLRNTWKNLSKQYTEEYESCIENILVTNKAEKFDYEGLHKALEQLSNFEKTANSRVTESGVLKGVNAEDVKRAGERLVLQDGCLDFFQSVIRNGKIDADVHLLSYCWCGDLIRTVFSSGGLDMQNIHANELIYEESISTGEIVKNVESPIDKVKVFNDILTKSNQKTNLTVYLGDSVGDLLCLLQADIGIVIGSSSSLRRLGTHFGVSFVPLFTGLVQKQKECGDDGNINWKGLSGVLYTVTSWAEIHAFVLGSFDQSQN